MSVHDTCFVFEPRIHGQKPLRQGAPAQAHASRLSQESDGALLRGRESSSLQHARLEAFQTSWQLQESNLQIKLDQSKSLNAKEVAVFLRECIPYASSKNLPFCCLLNNPENALPSGLLQAAVKEANLRDQILSLELAGSQCASTKAIVKCLLHEAAADRGHDANGTSGTVFKDAHVFSYDLTIIEVLVKRRALAGVTILFRDSEAISNDVLADTLSLLNTWRDRIPFSLVFGIRTSLAFFEAKLPQRILGSLAGRSLAVAYTRPEDILPSSRRRNESLIKDNGPGAQRRMHWLGSNASRKITARQRTNLLSPMTVVKSLKYMNMAHFFTSPFSAVLGAHDSIDDYCEEHWQALRSLPSFQRHCNDLLQSGKADAVKALLDDDHYLKKEFQRQVGLCSTVLDNVMDIVDLYADLQALTTERETDISELYALALSGQLRDSDETINILQALRRLPSKSLMPVVQRLTDFSGDQGDFSEAQRAVESFLLNLPEEQRLTLKSGNEFQHQNLRTTVVAQRVELSQQKSKLSDEEKEYTHILDNMHNTFETMLAQKLVNPQNIFPIEVLVCDQIAPYRDVFNPQSRTIIERSLIECHDYLGADFCGDDGRDCSWLRPATSVLYGLYLECGGLINIADMWLAFRTIMKSTSDCDSDEEEERTLHLFETALAELKYLGLVKSSRSKPDTLSKLSWKSL